MYSLNNIRVDIGDQTILHPLSLDLDEGQLCMIVGPNGAGKTTLLRALTGELLPASGSIEFNRRPLNSWPRKPLARTRAVLPQSSILEFPFTVYDVVEMGRMPHITGDDENREITEQVMEVCDCIHLRERAFTYLSGGEQQRVQIARALAQVWKDEDNLNRFLLLDEPISALDLSHQYSILKTFTGLAHDRGIGIICIVHNLNLATQFADRCIILDQGRLVADGPPAGVFTEETLSNVFDLDIWIMPHPENPDIPLIIPKLHN
jgi:iron complex transport system ATP-binding protein